MSASTRIAQRTLGTSQLGGFLVLLAVLAAIVAAIAFSTIGAKPADVAPAAGGFPAPVVRDLGSRDNLGTTKAVIPQPVPGYWRTDLSGNLVFVPFYPGKTDMSAGDVIGGNATKVKDDGYVSHGGWNGPRMPSATDDSNGGIRGPRLQAR